MALVWNRVMLSMIYIDLVALFVFYLNSLKNYSENLLWSTRKTIENKQITMIKWKNVYSCLLGSYDVLFVFYSRWRSIFSHGTPSSFRELVTDILAVWASFTFYFLCSCKWRAMCLLWRTSKLVAFLLIWIDKSIWETSRFSSKLISYLFGDWIVSASINFTKTNFLLPIK